MDVTARNHVNEAPAAADVVLDPRVDRWLGDHRPTWNLPALPMMSMADVLATAARARHPRLEVVAVRDLRAQRWITFDGPVRLTTEVTAERSGDDEVSLATSLLADGEPAASGEVILARRYASPPAPLPPLAGGVAPGNPYDSGVLFHGPAFQLLSRWRIDDTGATGSLDAAAGGVPLGTLHPALLDAGTHLIPHDDLNRWCEEIPAKLAAYPYRLVEARFYGRPPAGGEARCEARFEGLEKRRPVFRLQWIVEGRLWAEMRLEEVLLPKGRLGTAPPAERRAFVRDGEAIPGLGLSRFGRDATRLKTGEVRASDWLPGTIARIYRSAAPDREALTREVAVKDHVARRAGVHPRTVTVTAEGGVPEAEPLTLYPVTVGREGSEFVVTDWGPPRLDVAPMRDFWRRYLDTGPWPTEDVYFSLIERFVDRVRVVAAEALQAWYGRPLLFLANHQVGVESLLFSIVAGALVGRPTVTLATAEHRTTWLGRLIAHCFSYPGIVDPGVIAFFERENMRSLPKIIRQLGRDMAGNGKSVMVHVEGTRSLACRQPVRNLAGSFIDTAIKADAAVVPVRFSGGLPVEPLEKRLEFPVGCGRQDYWFGRPISPEELAALPYKDRRTAVVEAINGLGHDLEEEVPSAPDPEFAAEAEDWARRTGASPEHAVIYKALEKMERPGREIERLLRGVPEPGVGEVDDWLAELAGRLYGPSEPPPALALGRRGRISAEPTRNRRPHEL